MKLSDLYIGDVFLFNEIYYVIINVETLLIGVPDNITNVIFYIKNYYLNGIANPNTNQFFSINVPLCNYKNDTIPMTHPLTEGEIEKIPHEDIPLLVDIPDKTVWFEKVLNNDIENHGQNLHTIMKQALIEKGLDK